MEKDLKRKGIKEGIEFIQKLYSDIHQEAKNYKLYPYEKIGKYLNKLETVHEKAWEKEKWKERVKNLYYKKYVIKEIPDSYFELLKKIALERGYGHIEYDERLKKEEAQRIKDEQKQSLDVWLEYFISEDSKDYPMWLKYWSFQGMLKLGTYNKEKGEFNKRNNSTVAPFIELNREALSKTMDVIISSKIKLEDLDDEGLNKLVEAGSFQKIYPYILKEILLSKKTKNEIVEGMWVKYNQGSDHITLVKSLEGKGTGWCTAGEEMAKSHLSGGDFYVYYSYDEYGQATIPRLAIRMEFNEIAEIRGVDPNQEIEPSMLKVVEEKLKEFPDKDKYEKKVSDMKRLTMIYNECGERELTKEELAFLYETEEKIEGFGYSRDPRIAEIKEKRDIKKDLAKILAKMFNLSPNQIAINYEDLKKENIVLYYGDLKIDENKIPSDIYIPFYIYGSFFVKNLTSAKGLEKLTGIKGKADFYRLESATGLENLANIGVRADFSSLRSAIGLENLARIGGDAVFWNLESAVGLENLAIIGDAAGFGSLKSAAGLENLARIGSHAYFKNLKSAKGLEKLTGIKGLADFSRLESAVGLENLASIGGAAEFCRLEFATGLENLASIGGNAEFWNLESAVGLENLARIDGNALFSSLKSATGLKSLARIGGYAYFENLKSVDGLENLKVYKNFYNDYGIIPPAFNKEIDLSKSSIL